MKYNPAMFRQFSLLCIMAVAPTFATSEYEEIASEVPFGAYPEVTEEIEVVEEKPSSIGEYDIILKRVDGVLIYEGDVPPTASEKSSTDGVKFHQNFNSLDPLDKRILQDRISKVILYQPLNKNKMQEIRRVIVDYYKNHKKRPFVLVVIPEQEVSDRVLAVSIIESKLGTITVHGNQWFSDESYLEYMSLQEGSTINSDVLMSDLGWVNRNPFRKADVIFKPGTENYTTDVEIVANDYKPIQFYGGGDNTGFDVTDYGRLFVGFNWGNAFNSDQILAYQFTTAPDFHKYQSHTLHYTVPLPWRDILLLFGGYSTVHASAADLPANVSKGTSWQLSGRYVFPMPPIDTWLQEWKLGLDFKRTNNTFTVNDEVISDTLVSLFQFVGEYNTSFRFEWGFVEVNVEGFFSPGSLGSSMTKSAYATLRPGATNLYFYTRAGAGALIDLPLDFLLNLKAKTQLSTGTLLPLEQFGLGGFYSVRGYVDRAVNVDDALLLNAEVRTPKISLMQNLNKMSDPVDALSGVAFLDMGFGQQNSTVGTEQKSYTLVGIGPGLRYDIGQWLHARFDWGIRLSKIPINDHASRVYFSIVANY